MFKYFLLVLLLSTGISFQTVGQLQKERIETDTTFKKACTIYESLQKGARFDFIAILFSNDAATASKGGQMDWVKLDKLPKDAQKLVSKLAVNDFTKPIETADGFYFYKLIEKKEELYKLLLIYLKK